MSVLLNPGSGQLSEPHAFAAGASPVAYSSIDLNADSAPDFVVSNAFRNNLSILINACVP
jgi:hypothetical protein